MSFVHVVFVFLRTMLVSRSALAAENLALRQQLAVLERTAKRPRLRQRDRVFWVWLWRVWRNWRSVLVIVQPDTVVRRRRQGFRLYWRWKSRRGQVGRPRIERELRDLIRRICRENPTWGAPRIQSELRLLGYPVAESTVARYMIRGFKPPSPTWRAFLDNHVPTIAAVDFFTVPTVTFRALFGFVVLRHERRRIVHFNVTEHPTARWTAQQVVQAFPYDEASRFLIRDRDSIYGAYLRQRVKGTGIEEVVIAPRSPWQNPYCERLIGSIRRECLDHLIVLNEAHLLRIPASYFNYYHRSRTHLSLGRNAPMPCEIEPPGRGKIIAIPQVGGLHHRYTRRAA